LMARKNQAKRSDAGMRSRSVQLSVDWSERRFVERGGVSLKSEFREGSTSCRLKAVLRTKSNAGLHIKFQTRGGVQRFNFTGVMRTFFCRSVCYNAARLF